MKPTVSILLPFFDNAATLRESINSILSQEYEDFELLLIDKHSTDNSYDIAVEYANKDHRIKLIDVPGKGQVNALNSGIEAGEGRYIALMDARDIAAPQRLTEQISYLDENQNTGVVASCVEIPPEFDDNSYLAIYLKWSNQIITEEDFSLNRFIEIPAISSTFMIRRELFTRFGYFDHLEFPEDYELFLRWVEQGVNFYKLPSSLLLWRFPVQRLFDRDDQFSSQALLETKSVYLHRWLKENNSYYPEVIVWGAGKKARSRFAMIHELGVQAKFYIDQRGNEQYNVVEYKETPPVGHHFILCYIGNPEVRMQTKQFLVELGYTEGKDFICVT